ncbi:MAG: DinB family protein [bacterium]
MERSQINLFKWMLDDVRKETLAGVSHLNKDELFQPLAEGEYPVGAYLMHFAECEIWWLEVMSQIDQSEDLKIKAFSNKWFDPMETPEPPAKAMELDEYLEVLNESTKNLHDYLSTMNDSQLEEEVTVKGSKSDRKFSKKWIIYHLLEHEAHHRGQMFMLIRKAGLNKKK